MEGVDDSVGHQKNLNRSGWNYFIPSPMALRKWLSTAGFVDIRVDQLDQNRRIKAVATRIQHRDMLRAGLSRVDVR